MTQVRDDADDGMRAYLAERDVACPECGYNLRGLPGTVCPECRQELKLTVGLLESRIGALIACLGPLFAGTGASGGLLTFVTVVMFRYDGGLSSREALPLVWIPLGCFLSCAVPAILLCRRNGRAWFRSRSGQGRQAVVVTCLVVPLLWFIVLLGTLFTSLF